MEIGFLMLYSTSEAEESAKQWLKENKHLFYRNTSYAQFSAEGVLSGHLNQVCHKTMGYSPGFSPVLVATEIAISRRLETMVDGHGEELFIPFLKFILSDPLWSEYIVNKDDFDFCKDYGLLVDAGCPQNVLQALMITSRSFNEVHRRAFLLFNSLVEQGVPERGAFLLAWINSSSYKSYSSTDENPSFLPVSSAEFVLGHRIFPSDMIFGVETIKHYCEGELPSGAFTLSYSIRQSIYDVGRLFKSSRVGMKQYIREGECWEKVLKYRQGSLKKEGYRPPDPFAMDIPHSRNPFVVSYDEYYVVCIPHIVKELFDVDVIISPPV